MEDIHFQKLHEMIQDDDKIVTVGFLAHSLNISIQDSKKLLFKYLEDQRTLKPNESNELVVTYILTGLLKDKKKGVLMVKEINLDADRGLFENKPSETLYSVQKSKNVDFSVIALIDMFDKIREKPLLGSVVSKNCIKRVLKLKKLSSPPQPTNKGKSFFSSKSGSSEGTNKSRESEVKTKSAPIENLFNKLSSNVTNKKKIEKNVSSQPKPKPKSGLAGFVTKIHLNPDASKRKDTENENSDANNEIVKDIVNINNMDVDIKEEDENSIKEENKSVSKNEDKIKRKSSKRQRNENDEKSTKRRKRIKERNDSDSDDLFENDNYEDVIERSDDETEMVRSPITTKPLPSRNKKRKTADKTFMDKEGFVVTKTEYVYETASEDENEAPSKIEVERNTKSSQIEKKSSNTSENGILPQKGAKGRKAKKASAQNQPTLMTFFKKK